MAFVATMELHKNNITVVINCTILLLKLLKFFKCVCVEFSYVAVAMIQSVTEQVEIFFLSTEMASSANFLNCPKIVVENEVKPSV